MSEDIPNLFKMPTSRENAQRILDTRCGKYHNPGIRDQMIRDFTFAIPCTEAINRLVQLSPILEVGAGSGHWSRLLRDAGAEVVAVDSHQVAFHGYTYPFNTDTLNMDGPFAVDYFYPRTVFMCWPPYDKPFAFDVATKMRGGTTLAYIGELGGCTGDEDFFELLNSAFHFVGEIQIPRWSALNDAMYIYEKTAAAR